MARKPTLRGIKVLVEPLETKKCLKFGLRVTEIFAFELYSTWIEFRSDSSKYE